MTTSPDSDAAKVHAGCNCSSAVSLRRELVTIFGMPQPREGETWNAAMLRRITERLVEANV